jgi:hypothetical protein
MTRIHADVFAVSFSAEGSFRSVQIREIRGHFTRYFIWLNSEKTLEELQQLRKIGRGEMAAGFWCALTKLDRLKSECHGSV